MKATGDGCSRKAAVVRMVSESCPGAVSMQEVGELIRLVELAMARHMEERNRPD